jgi:hypothetical protein
VQLILKGARVHFQAADLVDNALHALACIAGKDSTMHYHMGQMSAVTFTQDAMRDHGTAPGVLTHACQLVTNLALHNELRALMVKNGVIDQVRVRQPRRTDPAVVQNTRGFLSSPSEIERVCGCVCVCDGGHF